MLRHFATLLGNFEDIWTEHKPQYNWELVKSLDSYYGSEAPTDSSQPDSSSLPEESKPEESSLPDSSSSSSSSNSSKGSVTPSSDSNPATGARGAAIATILLLAAGSITVSKKRR